MCQSQYVVRELEREGERRLRYRKEIKSLLITIVSQYPLWNRYSEGDKERREWREELMRVSVRWTVCEERKRVSERYLDGLQGRKKYLSMRDIYIYT